MRNLTDLFRRRSFAVADREDHQCPHMTLVPRWSNADDVGRGDRISSWVCSSCSESLPAEAVTSEVPR